ncbi:MAG: 3-dehydro-L-gulonate 2-dehydrogenase [Treponema sp.]|jgi:3-dehydro-L-gulonate 2-dehydrogenase|nr:3-dehydro-L-gulonate 2-dehydrogenase [Treponema sp.]
MRVPYDELKYEIRRVIMAAGLPAEKAEICAGIHADSSRDGIYSHGADRVVRFVDYLKKGWVQAEAEVSLEKAAGALEVYNGNLGPGILNALFCTERGMALAERFGIGLVGIHNTTHWMRGGTYGLHAARRGFAAIAWTNTESCMPPWGGRECRLGNNPFVMAAPVEGGAPLLLDMAMTQYSYGKLGTTRLAGKKLPFPGGFDERGDLTCDPGAIEATMRALPIGFWKGSAFSFMLDVLGAILSDGIAAADIDQVGKGSCGGASQVFIIINPDRCAESGRAAGIIRKAQEYIKSSAPAVETGDIHWPGEGVLRNREKNTAEGVFVDDTIWAGIKAL